MYAYSYTATNGVYSLSVLSQVSFTLQKETVKTENVIGDYLSAGQWSALSTTVEMRRSPMSARSVCVPTLVALAILGEFVHVFQRKTVVLEKSLRSLIFR